MQPNPNLFPLQIATLSCGRGMLGLTFCPGMNTDDAKTRSSGGTIYRRNLDDDLAVIKAWGASFIITLIEDFEFGRLRVRRLGQSIRDLDLAWHHMPIPDMAAPGEAFETIWLEHLPAIRAKLDAGARILIHCRHGRGRTGTVAARLLIEHGMEPSRAVDCVRSVAPACIATPAQENYLMSIGAGSAALPQPDYPPSVVIHLPHDAVAIPDTVRDQFNLDDEALQAELIRMTDHFTRGLFVPPGSGAQVVRAPVSRLVVDVERFPDDAEEPMAARGMGMIYSVTSHLQPMRRPLSKDERSGLMDAFYKPHHLRLENTVRRTLQEHGQSLVLDCHSFPGVALPYELAEPSKGRPDICIGTDPFHTSEALAMAFMETFARAGFSVSRDDPFAGALVPAFAYRTDPRVKAIMVDVNRGLYLDENDASKLPAFDSIAQRVRACCFEAIDAAMSADTA